MSSNSSNDYLDILDKLVAVCDPGEMINSLMLYALPIYRSDLQDRYSKPMLWIGMYIALASLFCILAMVADLLHGLRNRKLYFPCKYFTINAASLTIISVAMKLPVDLSNPMPGDVDQVAKLGSMAFMCTMMANFLPCLASMDSNELFTNIIALGVFVFTLVVNVCIQIHTGVVSYKEEAHILKAINANADLKTLGVYNQHRNSIVAIIYVTMLLVLLIIYICSSLAIVKSKQIIESKYQQAHDTASKDQQSGRLTVEKLEQRVSNYWIMAGTGSPQFITACSATTSASGVLCVLSTILHIFIMWWTVVKGEYNSDYKWSMLVIYIIQFIGVIVGTIAPLSRCFAGLSFKVSIKSMLNHIKVFKVESYWTQKLSDWKQSSIPSPFRSRKCEVVIDNLQILILNFCIVFQEAVVVTCKIISLIPFFCMICVFYCFRCLKWLKTMFRASKDESGKNMENLEQNNDLQKYVLQLQDEMEFAERTLNVLTKSVKRLIKKGEKKQPNDFMNLLAKSTGFEGVEKFDKGHVPFLLSKKYQNCWRLPIVTLTAIAISLPKIEKDKVNQLLNSVREGIVYVKQVEESLNDADDYVSMQKAAKMLWKEVLSQKKWLRNNLKDLASQEKTVGQIILRFKNTAKNMVTEVESENICKNSMYRITKTILLSYHANIDKVSQEELFDRLSKDISDIFSACLTNLPQVIAMKCHTIAIEKREANVQGAAQLLGETKQIINTLQARDLPKLDPNDWPFIDKWRASFP